MVSQELLDRVAVEVGRHVRASKGYETESSINPLTPVDSIAAFTMARELTEEGLFDVCVAVAPEGHVYGYFFELFGATVLSVHVDYPPRRCVVLDDLDVMRGKRVLVLEDDVASGTTLRLVIGAFLEHQPRSINVYLGRPKDAQILDNIDPAIVTVYLAEDRLDPCRRGEYEMKFTEFFERR